MRLRYYKSRRAVWVSRMRAVHFELVYYAVLVRIKRRGAGGDCPGIVPERRGESNARLYPFSSCVCVSLCAGRGVRGRRWGGEQPRFWGLPLPPLLCGSGRSGRAFVIHCKTKASARSRAIHCNRPEPPLLGEGARCVAVPGPGRGAAAGTPSPGSRGHFPCPPSFKGEISREGEQEADPGQRPDRPGPPGFSSAATGEDVVAAAGRGGCWRETRPAILF